MKYIKAAIAVIALVLLDQWTKVLAVTHLMNTNGVTISFWADAESKNFLCYFHNSCTGGSDIDLQKNTGY